MSLSIRDTLREYDVILASSSPRRRELIKLICPQFRVIPPECSERLPRDVSTLKAAEYLSDVKCRCIADVYDDSLVIGCDTVVICSGAIFGKPADEEDAKRMLRALSGREHSVISGVTVGYKAGAYGIQGMGSLLVEKLDGEFYNVVGLPVSELAARLDGFLQNE